MLSLIRTCRCSYTLGDPLPSLLPGFLVHSPASPSWSLLIITCLHTFHLLMPQTHGLLWLWLTFCYSVYSNLPTEIQNQWEKIFINTVSKCYGMNIIKQAESFDIKEYSPYHHFIQMRCSLTSLKCQVFL